MKKAKRMLAIFMTLAMVLTMTIAMSAVSFAAAPADSPLTVTGLAVGDVAHFYKVVEWAPNDTASVAGWKAVAPFDTVLTKEKLTEVLVGTPDDPETSESEYVAPTLITAALAGQLARLVEDVDPEDIISIEVGADKTAVLNLAEGGEGMYMALITPADVDTVYNPVFVSADFTAAGTNSWAVNEEATYSDTAAAKKSTVGLEKTASTSPEDEWDDAEWTTTAIGDTVSFTVKTTIPGYGTLYQNPVFKLTDKLTDLELKTDTVTLVAPAGLTENEDYTISATKSGYTIEFSADYLKKCVVPTAVEVKYDAIVTTTAPVHVNTEKNEVSTEFSHNPSDESDHGFKKDTTQHYTFTIDANALGSDSTQSGRRTSEIVKVGVKADGTPITDTRTTSEIDNREYVQGPLEGAKFELYTDSGATTKYVPKNADGTPGSPMDIRSDANGRLYVDGSEIEGIYGLDAGTYYLKEVEAPAGYVADQKAHKIVITAETAKVNVTEYTNDGITWISEEDYDALDDQKGYKSYTFETEVLSSYSITIDDQPVASYTFTNNGTDADIVWSETGPTEKPFPITNTQGTELPSTGGIGTIIFYTLGTILVVACGIVLISKRRLSRKR